MAIYQCQDSQSSTGEQLLYETGGPQAFILGYTARLP